MKRVEAHSQPQEGWITVRNEYQWMGNPGSGQFTIYVDGKNAGKVPLNEQWTVPVSPGEHTLGIRLRYFLSPRVAVTVRPQQTYVFGADIPRNKPVIYRIIRALADPFHSLLLEQRSQ